jgi:hypothetical protein
MRGAQRTLGALPEEGERLGHVIALDGGQGREHGLGGTAEPGSDLEDAGRPRPRGVGRDGRGDHAVVERVVAVPVVEVGDPERRLHQERPVAVGLAAGHARIERRRFVHEREGGRVGRGDREARGPHRRAVRSGERRAHVDAGRGGPPEQPGERRAE